MEASQLGQPGQQRRLANGHGHVDAQRAARPAAHALGLDSQRLDLLDDAAAAFVQRMAVACRADLPGGAIEQPQPEFRFEPGDALGHRRRRQAELARRHRKAALTGALGERQQGFDAGHSCLPIEELMSAMLRLLRLFSRRPSDGKVVALPPCGV